MAMALRPDQARPIPNPPEDARPSLNGWAMFAFRTVRDTFVAGVAIETLTGYVLPGAWPARLAGAGGTAILGGRLMGRAQQTHRAHGLKPLIDAHVETISTLGRRIGAQQLEPDVVALTLAREQMQLIHSALPLLPTDFPEEAALIERLSAASARLQCLTSAVLSHQVRRAASDGNPELPWDYAAIAALWDEPPAPPPAPPTVPGPFAPPPPAAGRHRLFGLSLTSQMWFVAGLFVPLQLPPGVRAIAATVAAGANEWSTRDQRRPIHDLLCQAQERLLECGEPEDLGDADLSIEALGAFVERLHGAAYDTNTAAVAAIAAGLDARDPIRTKVALLRHRLGHACHRFQSGLAAATENHRALTLAELRAAATALVAPQP